MKISDRKKGQRRKSGRRGKNFLTRLVLCAIIIMAAVLSVKSISLQRKKAANEEKIAQLESDLASEEARSAELDDYEEYVGTDEYIEQVAKDRLGLAYPDEKLLRPGD